MKTNIQSIINNSIYTTSNTINNIPITSITKGIYGFPIKQYEVETDDGYYITLLRIPRENTRKCVYEYIYIYYLSTIIVLNSNQFISTFLAVSVMYKPSI